MALVRFSLAGNVLSFEGPDVALLSDTPAPFSVVADFLDSIDVAAFRQLCESELDGGMASHPVDVVLQVLRVVVAGG